MLETEASSPPASASASSSAPDRHSVHSVDLKIPEFLADKALVWFAQTEAQFAVKVLTCSLTKFYYCVAALGRADAAQVVDLIEYCPDELPYESLRELLTKLHSLNPFQRYQEFMSLTLAADKKPSTLMGKMCSLLPLSHRVHKDECFLFKGFILDHLPPNIGTFLMGEDIPDLHKLATKADEIWQSSATRSVNAVSATSMAPPGCEDSAIALRQHPQSHPASHVAPCPTPRPAHPLSSSTTSDLCWYHRKHSDQAQYAELLAHGIRKTN